MSPAFDGKLLLVLSIFCFNGVFGSERGTKIELVSGTEGSKAQKSSLFHHRGRRHGSFDVMSFGAVADGQTDNTMVRSPPSLSQSKEFGYGGSEF